MEKKLMKVYEKELKDEAKKQKEVISKNTLLFVNTNIYIFDK